MARSAVIQSDFKAKNDHRHFAVGCSGRYLDFGISQRGPARSGDDGATATPGARLGPIGISD